MVEDTAPKQKHGFQKGVSGNPAGRPRGSRSKVTVLAEGLIDGEAEAVIRKLISLAKEGDTTALRIIADRIIPPRRDRHINLELPPVNDARSAADAMSLLIDAVASGELTGSESEGIAALIEKRAKLAEIADFEMRLRALEERAQ